MRIASLIFFFLMLFCRSSSSFPFFPRPRPRPPIPRPPPPRPPPPLLLVDSLLLPHLAPSRSFTQTNTLLFSFCLRLYSPFFHSYFFINLASSSPSLPPSVMRIWSVVKPCPLFLLHCFNSILFFSVNLCLFIAFFTRTLHSLFLSILSLFLSRAFNHIIFQV